jgi:DNA-binding CsgD family transcriptional regulator/transposase
MPSFALSLAEREVLCLIAAGCTDAAIAEKLARAPATIHTHCRHLLVKTGCRNRQQLTRYAVAAGLVSPTWDGPADSDRTADGGRDPGHGTAPDGRPACTEHSGAGPAAAVRPRQGAGTKRRAARRRRLTTAQQRRVVFETWEATGKVERACRAAQVGRGTFYHWKRRFIEGGYAALENGASRAPQHTRRIAAAVAQQVIALRQEHPGWGKWRISTVLASAHPSGQPVCPNTVKRILQDAGLWGGPPSSGARGSPRG